MESSTTQLNLIENRSSNEFSYDYVNLTVDYVNVTVDSTEEKDLVSQFSIAFGSFLILYYTPALVFIGSIGNILSVIVFFSKKLRKLSSSYYLAALSISDTCFLLSTLASWTTNIGVNVYNTNYFCQLSMYISGLSSFLSVWFVVAFTVERFVAVLFPLKRQSFCTVKRAKLVLTLLTAVGCLSNLPYLIFTGPEFPSFVCDAKKEFEVSLVERLGNISSDKFL